MLSPQRISFVRLPPPFRIPRPHMLISSACQGYNFEKVPLHKHHVASYTYLYRMRWRHIVEVASSACQGYSLDKVPLIKHHVTSYTCQYRKRWRHDVAVATFLFPYTPPKTYTCQKVYILLVLILYVYHNARFRKRKIRGQLIRTKSHAKPVSWLTFIMGYWRGM